MVQPIDFRGTLCNPDILQSAWLQKHAAGEIGGTACHTSVEDALRTAYVEAVERDHLWAWTKSYHDLGNILTRQLDLADCFIDAALLAYLRQHPIDYLLSFCHSATALPAVVCLAINSHGGYFYASSAAACSRHKAAEAALLDIAKMLLVENKIKGFSTEGAFRRSIDHLPAALMGSPLMYKWEPDSRVHEDVRIGGRGVLLGSPWLATLGLYVAAVSSEPSGPRPGALDWFT